mmetsp:Transcript_79575/g.170617  ORF Transcript_79575/g.170617 Transcript_79575/m.170617 type:complete len:666 (-) Transcript_79575:85-2082(-)
MSETDEGSSFSGASSPRGTATQATKLLRAAQKGDVQEVIRLLEATGAGVNSLRARGSTALHEAAKEAHLGVVMEIVRRGAQVNITNRSGCTALHYAVLCKEKVKALEVVRFLLDSAASVTATSERMDTPLHFAAYCPALPGCEEVVSMLLNARAGVNARNRNSETALINASLNDNIANMKVLIDNGAEIGTKNAMDKTAHDIATERGCTEAVSLLNKAKDPMSQLSDITQQMRTALYQMQTVDMLSNELKRQSMLNEAYESVAMAAVAALEGEAKANFAENVLRKVIADNDSRQETAGDGMLAPTLNPVSQQHTLQDLISLLLISRTRGGSTLLHELGSLEALPYVEQQASQCQIGHKQLRELRLALSNCQDDENAIGDETRSNRSLSSTPSSIETRSNRSSFSLIRTNGGAMSVMSQGSIGSSRGMGVHPSLAGAHNHLMVLAQQVCEEGDSEDEPNKPYERTDDKDKNLAASENGQDAGTRGGRRRSSQFRAGNKAPSAPCLINRSSVPTHILENPRRLVEFLTQETSTYASESVPSISSRNSSGGSEVGATGAPGAHKHKNHSPYASGKAARRVSGAVDTDVAMPGVPGAVLMSVPPVPREDSEDEGKAHDRKEASSKESELTGVLPDITTLKDEPTIRRTASSFVMPRWNRRQTTTSCVVN